MTSRLAYDEITLAHGDLTVRLRPSLRAATILERSHDGLAKLFRRIDEFHTGTIREIIATAATDRKDAATFLRQMEDEPLQTFLAITQAPVAELCLGFIPAADPDRKPAPNAKLMPWPKFYRDLYRLATGWLGWSPDQTWNATPTEISEALAGHIAKLKALHGGEEDESTEDQPDLGAKLDRDGLRKLRGKGRLR